MWRGKKEPYPMPKCLHQIVCAHAQMPKLHNLWFVWVMVFEKSVLVDISRQIFDDIIKISLVLLASTIFWSQ